MFQDGRLMICDRCGKEAFAKHIGNGEADGGYTRWNIFEDLEGWENVCEVGLLCPSCNSKYKQILDAFKCKVKEFKSGVELVDRVPPKDMYKQRKEK